MDIKEIAEQVSKRIYVEDGLLLSKFISEKFAEALIAELAKQNEPVACRYKDHNGHWCFMDKQYGNNEPLYTFPPTAEQIANETAEAIAKMVEFDTIDPEAIRSGAWKEFKK